MQLVATGEFDPNLVASPGGSREVVLHLQQRLPRAELAVLENTGHGSIAQRPTLCGRIFLEWATRCGLLPVGQVSPRL